MHTEPLPHSRPIEDFRWLPASRAWRIAVAIGAIALAGLIFCAYLRPNMVFDFANLVFCG